VLATLSQSEAAFADMSKPNAVSAGSFFAAAQACERVSRIPAGQVDTMLRTLNGYLTARNRRWMRDGFDEGSRRASVFIPEQGWVKTSTDDDECGRIQAVIDEYKSVLN
jgi:hypothetical protein